MLRRRWKVALGLALALVGIPMVVVGRYASRPASTEPIAGERAIAEFETIAVDGSRQTLLLRGVDREAPLLLYLHAGPGLAAMPIAAPFSRPLEKEFLVVHWDQRGAGKSCVLTPEAPTDYLETHVSDATRVVEHLRTRFGAKPMFLVGHASGAAIAAVLANRHPEWFTRVTLVAPLVDTVRNESDVLEFVRGAARERGDRELEAELAPVTVPFPDIATFSRVHDLASMEEPGSRGLLDHLADGVAVPEYTLHEKLTYLECVDASITAAWTSLWGIHLGESASSIDVPVSVMLGARDRHVSAKAVEAWFSELRSPAKSMVVLDWAGHDPMFDEPERFSRELIALSKPAPAGR